MTTTKQSKIYTQEELTAALLFTDDVMDRALCDYLVVGDVGAAIERDNINAVFESKRLELMVMKNNLTPEVLSVFKTYIPGIVIGEKDIQFEHLGVPVKIKIVTRHFKFIHYPDVRMYRVYTFRIPNPWSEYAKVRNFVS